MTYPRTIVATAFLLVAACIAVPALKAQDTGDSNWPTIITFTQPFQIENHVFSPGSYYFQLSPGTWARSVVMVYSRDKERWEGIFLGINVDRADAYSSRGFRTDARSSSGFTFINRGAANPDALEYWFYPGWERGVKFTYSPIQTAEKVKPAAAVAEARTPSSK
jgi:hypothetical protein